MVCWRGQTNQILFSALDAISKRTILIFDRVYIFVLFRRGDSNVYPQYMFWENWEKISKHSTENIQFLQLKKNLCISLTCFVMLNNLTDFKRPKQTYILHYG